MSFFKANINTNQNKEQLLDYILCEFKFIH